MTRIGLEPVSRRRVGGSGVVQLTIVLLAGAVFALGVGASEARPARSDQVTISMFFNTNGEPGMSVLISNFEHAYPNITVNATYEGTTPLEQLEAVELAAGTAPDLLFVTPGCGTPVALCVLEKGGDLAPMIKVPWAKRSLRLVISLEKRNGALYAFQPVVSLQGIFTNDGLFAKLGLKVPQTFSQLLALCQQAQTDGTVAIDLHGTSAGEVPYMILNLATPLVYEQGTHWTAALRAGTVGFDGTAGWRQALQEVVDMNNAGCFESGAAGSSVPLFAQGKALMRTGGSVNKGSIDVANPDFAYTFRPFSAATSPGQPQTFLALPAAVGVNAHSSAQNQAGAQTFVNFIARPDQDREYARLTGGLTQYEFLHDQIPAFMSDFATIIKDHEYVPDPSLYWWNLNVWEALTTDGIGLITGQETPDNILQAMDAAWKQGPS